MLNIEGAFLWLLIVFIFGLPGVGKTRLANELAPLINAVVLSIDKIRKELIPKPTYTKEEKKLIYEVMLLVTRYLHNMARVNCILDATFNTEESRRTAREKLTGITPEQIYMVECTCSEDVIISRLNARKGDYSDADIEIYRKMKKTYEPIKEEERHIVIDTNRDPMINAEEIKAWIFAK